MAKRLAHKSIWAIEIGQTAVRAMLCFRNLAEPTEMVVAYAGCFPYEEPLYFDGVDRSAAIQKTLAKLQESDRLGGAYVIAILPPNVGQVEFIPQVKTLNHSDSSVAKEHVTKSSDIKIDEFSWDYQRLPSKPGSDSTSGGDRLGIFSIEKNLLRDALVPFEEAGIKVDYVQMSSVAIYNALAYDLRFHQESESSENGVPISVVAVSMNSGCTEILALNECDLFRRCVSIGGNLFTEGVFRDLKLSYSGAEYLKINASKAEDPKSLFQAMRPAFSSILSDIERTMKYLPRRSDDWYCEKIIAIGQPFQLPGIVRFLKQNLGFQVEHEWNPRALAADERAAKELRDFSSHYVTVYGACLQGLGVSSLYPVIPLRESPLEKTSRRMNKYLTSLKQLKRAKANPVSQPPMDPRACFDQAVAELLRFVEGQNRAAPKCFISYAWGNSKHEQWVNDRLATDLKTAGAEVIFDRWDNNFIGDDIGDHIARIDECERIIVVGTPEYLIKTKNKTGRASTVFREWKIIRALIEDPQYVVTPLLLAGNKKTSLPLELRDKNLSNFSDESYYFSSMILLLLTIHAIKETGPFGRKVLSFLKDAGSR